MAMTKQERTSILQVLEDFWCDPDMTADEAIADLYCLGAPIKLIEAFREYYE